MLTDEERRNLLILLLGVALGLMGGFMFGWLVNDPVAWKPQVSSFYTTFIGCFITIGFVLLYLYITEWSKLHVARGEHMKKEAA
nr:hypothetical protein [Candidatus Sigynarchaeota archaeon]